MIDLFFMIIRSVLDPSTDVEVYFEAEVGFRFRESTVLPGGILMLCCVAARCRMRAT